MVFSSLSFIVGFMPLFFTCYYLTPNQLKNLTLLIGSLIFYAIGTYKTPWHYALFIFFMVFDFYCGLSIDKNRKYKKALLLLAIATHIAMLFYVKYFSFVVEQFNLFISHQASTISIILPIGISFYTFQGISYLIDVYRNDIKPEKSLLNYCVYISMFPQLIAGPIVTHKSVKKHLITRSVTANRVIYGIYVFIFGLSLKVLLANPLGKCWGQIQAIGFESISTPLAWIGIAAFSLQIYLDFFGYSLMAIGLGKMLGFNYPKNFNHPYTATSLSDFWRRWHMTLGSWFKNYVYIPLGGNQTTLLKLVRNLFIVWMLTAIWHGAGYHFILWGFFLFFFITLEKLILAPFLTKHKAIAHCYLLLLIVFSWAIFAIEDINQLGIFISRLFPFISSYTPLFALDYMKYLSLYWSFITIGILLCLPKTYTYLSKLKQPLVLAVVMVILLLACMYCMKVGLDDPFLYFRF